MANAIAHRTVAAVLAGVAIFNIEAKEGKQTFAPIGGSILAAICTNLPDKLEPAIHPHHRQFFHSLFFAGLVGYGMHKTYEWNPDAEFDKFMRFCLLVAGAGVLIHLAIDSATPRSIQFLGRL